jgi:exodeoxyribonuclease V gamma subunit
MALARAGGLLPHGALGTVLFENETDFLDRYVQKLETLLPRDSVGPVPFELTSEHITLKGMLTGLSSAGLFVYRVATANERARIEAWIRHLALNAFAPPRVDRTSRLIAVDGMLTFAPLPNARQLLTQLQELYWKGLHRPLHLFPRTACAYAEGDGTINNKVRNVWEATGRDARPECDDAYYKVAFRGMDPLDSEFEIAAHALFGEMKRVITKAPFV